MLVFLGVFLLLCLSAVSAYYCDGHWVDRSSLSDSFMNYSLNGARTVFDYSDPKSSLQQFLQEACPAQVVRFSCYWHSDDPVRSRKQEEMHFVPHNPSSCKAFEPHSFLKKMHNRRVVLIGDSVMSQAWYSLVCSLYKAEENHLHVQTPAFHGWPCRRDRCPVAPNPDESKPDPQRKETQSGYINFKRSNVSVSFQRLPKMGADVQAFVRKQGLSSSDVLIVGMGLHYNLEIDEFRRDMDSMAKWMQSFASPPHFLILHAPPQHFNESNGYYSTASTFNRIPQCFPLQGWNDSAHPKKLPLNDWRNEVLEAAFSPLVKQQKAFIVPISMGLNGRHDSHLGWGDCTHWCFPSTIFKYVHMMIYNALQRVLPRRTQKIAPPPIGWWKSHPGLRDGMLIQFDGDNKVYLVEKGVLREYRNADAVSSRRFDVFRFARDELGPVQFGESIF